MRWFEANAMVTRVCGTESELAAGGALLRDDAVVGSEDLIDRDEDTKVGIGHVVVEGGIVFFSFVVSFRRS